MKMSTILTITAILLLSGTVYGQEQCNNSSLTDEDMYWIGLYDGYKLKTLWIEGQTNETAKTRYNVMVEEINNKMDELNWTQARLVQMHSTEYKLPPVFTASATAEAH